MNVLVADDHEKNRKLLSVLLAAEGYTVREARDGREALAGLRENTGPLVALIDWQMPVVTGVEVCTQARRLPGANLLYLILITVRDSSGDIVAGLKAGANDYVTKPFDNDELLARVRVGAEMATLQDALAQRVHDLEAALAQIKQLRGLLPICCYCKKVRDDRNYWQQVEAYIAAHSDLKFTHGICPDCYVKIVEPELESYEQRQRDKPSSGPGAPPGS